MTDTEQQLNQLNEQIKYHRKKGDSLYRRGDAQHRIANEKVKQAAALGTGTLPLLAAPETAPGFSFQFHITGTPKKPDAPGTGELPIMKRTGMSDDPRGSYTADGTFRMD